MPASEPKESIQKSSVSAQTGQERAIAFCVISRAESPGQFFERSVADVGIQKFVDAAKAAAGENFFARDAGKPLLQEIEELDFAIVARREIGGAALGGSGVISRAIPEEHGFAEASACGDQGFVGVGLGNNFVEREEIVRREFVDAAGGCDQVVDQDDIGGMKIELCRERRGVEDPGKIDGVKPAVEDRACYAEARCGELNIGLDRALLSLGGFAGERVDELLEAGEITGGVAILEDKLQRRTALLESSEIAFGTADVAGQDHVERSIRSVLPCGVRAAMRGGILGW